jgi:hypothetical protein
MRVVAGEVNGQVGFPHSILEWQAIGSVVVIFRLPLPRLTKFELLNYTLPRYRRRFG